MDKASDFGSEDCAFESHRGRETFCYPFSLHFKLLKNDRLTLFAATVRVCFLLFEALRSHLKFQLEAYVTKMMQIVVSDSAGVADDKREMALESIVQLLRVPALVTELYLNYDCDLYSSDLFEDLMKLLSKVSTLDSVVGFENNIIATQL